jgi:hypothetical protein
MTATFTDELKKDTLMYSTYINADKLIPGSNFLLGPYFISLDNTDKVGLRQNNTFSVKEETGDIFQFGICKKNICANAESFFYEKAKTTLVGGKNGGSRVRAEKIYGQIYLNNQPAMNFEVNRMGRLRGYGFFRISDDQIIRIKPIGKKTNYGKRAYGVGLDFTMDGKTIGGFIQRKGVITVAVKKGLEDNVELLLTALSLALINRSNEIIIL